MKEVGKILKDRRKELGLTMKEVGDMCGVAEATISRWESGDIANMRRDRIGKLADALHISPSVIMGWNKKVDYVLTDNERHLIEVARRLPPDRFDKFVKFIDLYAEFIKEE